MQDGFVRIAAGTPQVFLADTQKNARAIIEMMRAADARRAKLLVLPEMCLTGYTVGDLVLKDTLLRGALEGLGGCPAQEEEQRLAYAQTQLETALDAARAEAAQQRRLYRTLGLSLGGAAALLLL